MATLVATTDDVAATSSRNSKTAALAELLNVLEPQEIAPAIGFLIGEPIQGRIGVGWATVAGLAAEPAAEPSVSIAELDSTLATLATTSGPGSVGARSALLEQLMSSATAAEQNFIRRLLTGELRQGALDGVMVSAIAKAAGVPAAVVRRSYMLSGRLEATASVALQAGRSGLEAMGLQVGRPIRPMLASTAPGVAEAVADLGQVSVEWKLDGARIQVHRQGDQVSIYTRNLNEITDRLPGVVAAVLALPVDSIVLDGESLGMDIDGRPRPFQDTMAQFGTQSALSADQPESGLRPWFFDCLHVDGVDLLDEPLTRRLAELERIAPAMRIPGIITDDPAVAEKVLADSLAAGHEGVMVKVADSPYEAGRRGKTWRKVKPVHTFDLVVLAVEWGSGRRRGWLSNIHMGARDPGSESGFVMVGKTFKGMTDEILAWQTERFLQLETRRTQQTVFLRPEQVVEVAIDGVQRSTRYPGGVALRFARVLRYRDDKPPAEADTIDSLRAGMANTVEVR